MKLEIKNNIMAALEQYMQLHSISANEMAKRTRVNAGYLSNMRAGNFKVLSGDNEVEIADKYFMQIAQAINYELEKSYWETVETPQLLRILATLQDAREFGYTNVIIGETGSGKTFVAQKFAQAFPLDVFYIKISSQDNMADLMEKICDVLHMATEKTKSRTLRAIARKLQAMKADGLKPIVLFDEAEYMKQPALCNMKELYDYLNGIASLVLIGTDQLTANIDKMRKKNRAGIPQFYRRVKFGIRVLPNIDRTFKQFLNGSLNDKNVTKFLRQHCDNYGELHDVLVPALREADRTGEPLTENLIRTMLNRPNN